MNDCKTVLPVSNTLQNQFFLAHDGYPVWLIQNAEERRALSRVTKLFGARTETVRAKPGAVEPCQERVVALGEDVREEAALYAHLTSRQLEVVEQPLDLNTSDLPAVLVVKPSRLSVEFLDQVYAPVPREAVPGIICAEDRGDLHRQVLIRSAAASLCGALERARVDVLPTVPVGRHRASTYELLGNQASPEELHEALGAGSGVLTLMTHSDGIDAYLGPLVLCPMDRSPLH